MTTSTGSAGDDPGTTVPSVAAPIVGAPLTGAGGATLTAGWPWWVRVGAGALFVPAALLAAGGLLWLAGTALRPIAGPGAPLAGHDLALSIGLWLVVPALAITAIVRLRHPSPRVSRPTPTAPSAPPGNGVGADGDGSVRPDPVPSLARAGARGAVGPAWSGQLARLAVALIAALIVVGPFAASPRAARWVGAYDAPYNAWLGWRIGEAMRVGTWLPTTVPDALWPAGIDLLVTDGLLPAYVTGLLNVIGLGPYVAYNATLLLGVGLSIWAGRRLGQALTDRPWVALACGLAFATAPMVAGPVQAHVAFVWSFAVPLLVRRAVLEARGERTRPLGLAALLVVAFLCSAYHLVFGGLAYLLVGMAWPGSALRRPAPLLRVAAAGLVAVVVLSPFLVSRLSFEHDERAAGGEDATRVADAFLLSADALSAVVPPDELVIDVPAPAPSLGPVAFASLRIAFPGLALLVGSGIAVVLRRRGAAALVGTAGALWLLSLGPALHWGGRYPVDGSLVGSTAWLPFRLVLEVPGLGNLRAPYRASFAIAAVLAGAATLGLAAVLDHLDTTAASRPSGAAVGRHRTAVGAAVLAVLVLSLLGPLPTSDLGLTDGQRAALADIGRSTHPNGQEAVVVVPFGCRLDDPRIIALQIEHRNPSLGCSTSRAATPWAAGLDAWGQSEALRALWCGEPAVGALFARAGTGAADGATATVEGLRALGVRHLIVDRGGIDPSRCPGLPALVDAVAESATEPGATGRVIEADGWIVIDLGVAPASGPAVAVAGTPFLAGRDGGGFGS